MASPAVAHRLSNKLLTALPASDLGRLRRHLEPVSLDLSTVIYEAGDPANFVYFPTSGTGARLHGMWGANRGASPPKLQT